MQKSDQQWYPAISAECLSERKRKANLEASRDALGSRHGDEKGMEVGAVAFLGVAGIEHVAVSPAGSGFVVLHGGEDVIVDGAGFVEMIGLASSDLHGKIGRVAR